MAQTDVTTYQAAHSTRCPACGSETGIEREIEPALGGVALDELEILVRNEWRRRLGPEAYERRHSRAPIRALIVYALAADVPLREAVLRETLTWELARLVAQGVPTSVGQQDLRELGQAIRATLSTVAPGGPGAVSQRLSDPIEAILAALLDAPAAHGIEGSSAPDSR